MKLAPGLHLVASGLSGLSVSDPLDCSVWLIDSGDGLVAFDAGCGRDIGALTDAIAEDGLAPESLRHVFLTHAHADHSGGAAPLKALLPDLTLHAGREAARRMATDDERAISLDTARRLGVYPVDYRWSGLPVDNVVADRETIRIGRATIELVETPGHSDDHCAFLVTLGDRRILVAGDAVFADGRVILQDIPDCRVAETIASIRRLAGLAFETFLPGHGRFAITGGMHHVARAKAYADTGLCPPSLF